MERARLKRLIRNTKENDSTRGSAKKIRVVLSFAVFFAALGLFVCFVGLPLLSLVAHPVAFRMKIHSLGVWGFVLFLLMIAAQVISAVLPAAGFQFASGYMYGALAGALIYDTVAALTSTLIYLFSQRLGGPLFRKLLEKQRTKAENSLLRLPDDEESKGLVTFLLYLVPGFPKDLIPYLFGVLDMPTWQFGILCFAGRFPTIFLTSLSGNELGHERYGNVAIFAIAIAALTIAGSYLAKRTLDKSKKKSKTKENKEDKQEQ